MAKGFYTTILIILLALAVNAQQYPLVPFGYRIEAGMGIYAIDSKNGIIFRGALLSNNADWGLTLRFTEISIGKAAAGGKFDSPGSNLADGGLMVSRVVNKHQLMRLSTSAGAGFLLGVGADENKKSATGFIWELSLSSCRKHVGYSVTLLGNINSEVSLMAVVLSISLASNTRIFKY